MQPAKPRTKYKFVNKAVARVISDSFSFPPLPSNVERVWNEFGCKINIEISIAYRAEGE